MYLLILPFMFSTVPFSREWYAWQKNINRSKLSEISLWLEFSLPLSVVKVNLIPLGNIPNLLIKASLLVTANLSKSLVKSVSLVTLSTVTDRAVLSVSLPMMLSVSQSPTLDLLLTISGLKSMEIEPEILPEASLLTVLPNFFILFFLPEISSGDQPNLKCSLTYRNTRGFLSGA